MSLLGRPIYRGRFAPSPTGPLHFGSLVAATASYLDARAARGEWLVRIEDLDPPREMPGAADAILHTLDRFGFEWDGPVLRQSTRGTRYAAILAALGERERLYPCACSRREVGDGVYSGTCAEGLAVGKTARAYRFRVKDVTVEFEDALQGTFRQHLVDDVGDFILKRADGPFAYQLAVVVDDFDQGITDVVRGADLLDSTPRQIHLQQALDWPTPRYLHVPIATNLAGEKLSKQTLAPAVSNAPAVKDATRVSSAALAAALGFLGHALPDDLHTAPLADLWTWAVANWSRARLPRTAAIPAVVE